MSNSSSTCNFVLPSESALQGNTFIVLAEDTIPINDSNLLLTKVKYDSEQSWFWTKQWQDMEVEADLNIEEGNIETFDSPESLINSLPG